MSGDIAKFVVPLSLVPFYRQTVTKIYRLQFLSDFQYSNIETTSFRIYRFGPTFSFISKDFALHPKLQFGYSKVEADYRMAVHHDPVYTSTSGTGSMYRWNADSCRVNQYRFFTEPGATFEFPLSKIVSLLADLSGTYQYLFSYDTNYVHLSYAVISPSVKLSPGRNISLITGMAMPLNPDMSRQLPAQ